MKLLKIQILLMVALFGSAVAMQGMTSKAYRVAAKRAYPKSLGVRLQSGRAPKKYSGGWDQELEQEENQEETQGGWTSWVKSLFSPSVSEETKSEMKREQEKKDVKDLMRRTIQSKLFPVGSAMSEDSIVDVLEMSDKNPELKDTMNADDLRYSHWDAGTREFFYEQYDAYLRSGQKWKNYYRNFDDAVNDRMEEKFSKKEYKKQRDKAFLKAGYSPEGLSINESDYNNWKARRGWGGHFSTRK